MGEGCILHMLSMTLMVTGSNSPPQICVPHVITAEQQCVHVPGSLCTYDRGSRCEEEALTMRESQQHGYHPISLGKYAGHKKLGAILFVVRRKLL